MDYIIISAVVGVLISVYVLYVRSNMNHRGYHALCDLNNMFSCTKAFKSKYSQTFGLPNSYWGILFYSAVIILAILGQVKIIFFLSLPAILVTMYLANALYKNVKSICLVCNAIYLINILILVFSFKEAF